MRDIKTRTHLAPLEKHTASIAALVKKAVDSIAPNDTQLTALSVLELAEDIQAACRAFYSAGYTAKDLAPIWGVTLNRAQQFMAWAHKKHGVGRKFGKTWVWNNEEVAAHAPTERGNPNF